MLVGPVLDKLAAVDAGSGMQIFSSQIGLQRSFNVREQLSKP